MFRKITALLSAIFLSSSAVAQPYLPEIDKSPAIQSYFIALDSVPYIDCVKYSGSGEVIGKNLVLTADHVVAGYPHCSVWNKPAKIIYRNTERDIAILHVDTSDRPRYEIDCRGFVNGETYFAVGFAHGRDFAVTMLHSYGKHNSIIDVETMISRSQMAVLDGFFYSGMSGGPVVDAYGRLVGMVNATSTATKRVAYSRAFIDTPLCPRDK